MKKMEKYGDFLLLVKMSECKVMMVVYGRNKSEKAGDNEDRHLPKRNGNKLEQVLNGGMWEQIGQTSANNP